MIRGVLIEVARYKGVDQVQSGSNPGSSWWTRRSSWELARDGAYEFAFIFAPLRLKGATGSPGDPIAIR